MEGAASKGGSDPRQTPAMQQYYRFKKLHPDCVLLFRIGDFYEMFDDDAVAVSKAVGLTLTQRTAGIPMAGVPHHQLETYLKRLVKAGFRVAIGEQLVDASQIPAGKGIVPRAVTRVVTPGTVVDDALLDPDAPHALAAVWFAGEEGDAPATLAIADVAGGEFRIIDVPGSGGGVADRIVDELAGRGVREVLFASPPDGKAPARIERILSPLGLSGTARPAWQFRMEEAREALCEQFKVRTLEGFGLTPDDPGIPPAGAIVRYLSETQTLSEELKREAAASLKALGQGGAIQAANATLAHLRPPRRDPSGAFLAIDAASLRALEVVQTLRAPVDAGGEGSLLSLFTGGRGSAARTAMGRRLLRDWLCRPSRDLGEIRGRQDAVATLVADRTLAEKVGEALAGVQDVERLSGRAALGRASPRDVLALSRSLEAGEAVLALVEGAPALAGVRDRLARSLPALRAWRESVARSFVEEPPAHAREGGIYRDGVDAALDESRSLQRDAGAWLARYQAELVAKHNLPGLKVGYNRVFGYYIELPQAQARQAPAELSRKQTLKNAERYTTPDLAEFERKVTSAEARAVERERELFLAAVASLVAILAPVAEAGSALARLDALLALADKAHRRGWVRPEVVEEPVLRLAGARHPVLDELLGARFVPNDLDLGPREHDGAGASLALITGPNMAGKSTFIRQVALLTLLAHVGSFVPADRAVVGLTDRIFTRIGADDALHAGQSTFMVEMIETANILHHATPSSLVVLDEIGRGTSTLDGLSLAWAIAEYLSGGAGGEHASPRTLFATHYHELTDLESRFPGRVVNLHVAVREWPPGDPHAQIVFLHRILPGKTDQSYGVHVARLAGIPAGVVARAREVLASLAVQHTTANGEGARARRRLATTRIPSADEASQLPLFAPNAPHPALDALREIKLEAMSPMQAFDALRRLRDLAEGTPPAGV